MPSSGSHCRGGRHLTVLDIPPPEALRILPPYRRTSFRRIQVVAEDRFRDFRSEAHPEFANRSKSVSVAPHCHVRGHKSRMPCIKARSEGRTIEIQARLAISAYLSENNRNCCFV